MLIHAILSAEDKRFFQHAGFDPIRIIKVRDGGRRERQERTGRIYPKHAARQVALPDGPERSWRRKLPEAMITLQLEQRLTKQEILELYATRSRSATAAASRSAASARPRAPISARTCTA